MERWLELMEQRSQNELKDNMRLDIIITIFFIVVVIFMVILGYQYSRQSGQTKTTVVNYLPAKSSVQIDIESAKKACNDKIKTYDENFGDPKFECQ